MSNINKVQASIEKLHGGDREQRSKYTSFLAWQIKQRRAQSGDVAPSILKKVEGDDAAEYERTFGLPL